MPIQIGDRVEAVVDHPANSHDIVSGMQGTVVHIYDGYDGVEVVSVRWDRKVHCGHSCSGRCEDGYGWNVRYIDLCVVQDDPFEEDESINSLIQSFRRGAS